VNAGAGSFGAFAPRALLTRGQLQLVERAARGETALEIAAALGVAANTVEMGLQRARLRLGARNTAHLAAIAVARGLVDTRTICLAAEAFGPGERV
jgi:DNA-binding CsgD family transcriptional regulator